MIDWHELVAVLNPATGEYENATVANAIRRACEIADEQKRTIDIRQGVNLVLTVYPTGAR